MTINLNPVRFWIVKNSDKKTISKIENTNINSEIYTYNYNDLNKYPDAAHLFDFVSLTKERRTNRIPSQLRFFETIEKGKSIQSGHFEEFLRGKQKISPETYFIRMNYYQKDEFWAKEMEGLTYFISDLMSHNVDFDDILKSISLGIFYINQNKSDSYGLLKSEHVEKTVAMAYSVEKCKRGEEYFEKYKQKIKKSCYPRAMDEYNKKANCSCIFYESDTDSFLVSYPYFESLDNTNLDIVKDVYNELKSIKKPSKKQIVEAMAKIQWLIAQETPYIKGSDSVANLLTRSIAHAYNLPVSPLKEGISLDFEAWYQNMDKYIKHYPNYFERSPLR